MLETASIKPSCKKPFYPVNKALRSYLKKWGRDIPLPVTYADMERISYSTPLLDKNGVDTLWEEAHYDLRSWDELQQDLIKLYALLKTEGDFTFTKHLRVARIDYCPFGNSNPFRVRIVNRFNDNADYFYIKKEDASRIYGLELEHILSPYRMKFLAGPGTMVEEHIAGIPGDLFVKDYFHTTTTSNKIRLAKELVKFNERCFVRLLGDMRSYNYVVDITPDIEDFQYRLRPIDFDQQCYEGRANLYRPQFFKENLPYVDLVQQYLNKESIEQYRMEERTLMAFRLFSSRRRMLDLMNLMVREELSKPEKIESLKQQLNSQHFTDRFNRCHTMGQVLKQNLKQSLRKNIKLIMQ